MNGNTIQYTDLWYNDHKKTMETRDELIYHYGMFCDLGCSGDTCKWGSSDGQTIDFNPESIR